MYISVTGYFGSGSSAVLDLLSEYECNGSIVLNKSGGYEHNTLYYPGGLFDLEDKLLINNDIHRSDEALATFKKEMLRLNNYNFGWYGSFNNLFGSKFEDNLLGFINDLHPFTLNTRYYGQCEKVIFNPLKVPVQFLAKVLLGRKIYKWGRQYIYNNHKALMTVAFPSDDEFYLAAKKFIKAYMEMFREEGKDNVIFDRLLMCSNLKRLPKYFDDDFRIIRVKRDIRDLYVLNKYIWRKIHAGTMYPYGITDFIDFWKRLERIENKIQDSRILSINFEDLIYNYDETVKKIEVHCGISKEFHNEKNRYFNPERSIKNTQVYKINQQWANEINLLEKELSDYLFDFPYEIKTEIESMFDDSRAEERKGLLRIFRR